MHPLPRLGHRGLPHFIRVWDGGWGGLLALSSYRSDMTLRNRLLPSVSSLSFSLCLHPPVALTCFGVWAHAAVQAPLASWTTQPGGRSCSPAGAMPMSVNPCGRLFAGQICWRVGCGGRAVASCTASVSSLSAVDRLDPWVNVCCGGRCSPSGVASGRADVQRVPTQKGWPLRGFRLCHHPAGAACGAHHIGFRISLVCVPVSCPRRLTALGPVDRFDAIVRHEHEQGTQREYV